jgi:hypothetical protein
MSDASRESFFGQLVPGEDYGEESSKAPAGGRDKDGKVLPPSENFLLMLLDPKDVDYLRLSRGQCRQMDTRGLSGWSMAKVNP